MIKSLIKKQILQNVFVHYTRKYCHKNAAKISLTNSADCPNSLKHFLNNNSSIHEDSIIRFYKNFEDVGVSIEIVHQILKTCPELLKLSSSKLNDNLTGLINCNLGDEFVEIILTQPSILFLSKQHVHTRYTNLALMFPHRTISKIILKSPLVLIEPLDDLLRKVKYLEKDMKYSKNEIIKSGALNHSFSQIKNRFDFMLRAGVFKIPNSKTLEIDKLNNPMLSKILSLNNHDFANQIVGVSLLEFQVFEEMISHMENSDYEDTDSSVIGV